MAIFKPETKRIIDIMRGALDAIKGLSPRAGRACRVCGCTQYNCVGCYKRNGMACWWVDETLCSACATTSDPTEIRLAQTFVRALSLAHIETAPDAIHQEAMAATFLAVRRSLAASAPQLTVCNAFRVSQFVPMLGLDTPPALPAPLSPMLPEPLQDGGPGDHSWEAQKRGKAPVDTYDLRGLMPRAPGFDASRYATAQNMAQQPKENG